MENTTMMKSDVAMTAEHYTTLQQIIEGRHAVRHYDETFEIAKEEIKQLLELATRAPSSSNLQPWRIIVVDDKQLQQQIVPIASNQQQVAQASAVILLFADTKMYEKSEQVAEAAYVAGIADQPLRDRMVASFRKQYGAMTDDRLKSIALFDAGMIAMNIMLLAKARGYETGPMGGFDHEQLKQLFGISDRYVPALMMPIGKAASPGRPTARMPISEVIAFNQSFD
ncbi:nitroreductase family protein [Paenibacillus yanchengensis]|uniref:Nitroreductase family protein n=1 Tax=Paenibacillus yanchengensis TaxID=2035833 RepID=A0ABW4YIB2_9BACL